MVLFAAHQSALNSVGCLIVWPLAYPFPYPHGCTCVCVCVCVCVVVCVCACVSLCVCLDGCASVWVCMIPSVPCACASACTCCCCHRNTACDVWMPFTQPLPFYWRAVCVCVHLEEEERWVQWCIKNKGTLVPSPPPPQCDMCCSVAFSWIPSLHAPPPIGTRGEGKAEQSCCPGAAVAFPPCPPYHHPSN